MLDPPRSWSRNKVSPLPVRWFARVTRKCCSPLLGKHALPIDMRTNRPYVLRGVNGKARCPLVGCRCVLYVREVGLVHTLTSTFNRRAVMPIYLQYDGIDGEVSASG